MNIFAKSLLTQKKQTNCIINVRSANTARATIDNTTVYPYNDIYITQQAVGTTYIYIDIDTSAVTLSGISLEIDDFSFNDENYYLPITTNSNIGFRITIQPAKNRSTDINTKYPVGTYVLNGRIKETSTSKVLQRFKIHFVVSFT